MTEGRQLGKGVQIGLIEDKYVGIISQIDGGEVMTLLTPSQALLFAQFVIDKANELLSRPDEDTEGV